MAVWYGFLGLCSMNRTLVLGTVAAVAAGASLVGAEIRADELQTGQVWLVSSRNAPYCSPGAGSYQQLDYWSMEPGGKWASSDDNAFMASDHPEVPTTIFIHGNRSDRDDAVREGSAIYRQLFAVKSQHPFRFVVWSWPADRISKRPRPDLWIKAARSDVQSYYLAQFISRMDPDMCVNLIGYSYGARTITGALELLAGGEVAGFRLDGPRTCRTGPIRAVLVAAAIHNDWLLPGRRYGRALSQLEHVLVTYNPCDPALRLYPLLFRGQASGALGYTGPACPKCLGADRKKIEILDVARSVGKNHGWLDYLSSPWLRARLGWYCCLEGNEAARPAMQIRSERL
jgi:hypothetical protein